MVPGWPPEKLEAKTGIKERRFLWELDHVSGYAVEPQGPIKGNVDMALEALRQALDMANMDADELDALYLVTATPDVVSFQSDVMKLATRIGMRPDARVFQEDCGCGGAMYYMVDARERVEAGRQKNVAVVASHITSAQVDRNMYSRFASFDNGKKLGAFLTAGIFGDGAGALVLGPSDDDSVGCINTWSEYRYIEYMRREGGGGMKPPYSPRSEIVDFAFIVDGGLVAKEFPVFMKRSLDGVFVGYENLLQKVDRFYLHQANKLLVEKFAQGIGLPMDRVPMNMDRYGNTSAAGTLILLSEDLRDGTVSLGSGQLIAGAAIGAGAHYGSVIYIL
jgi:3-oxoacyl-[acyl-carrier-protein] synthase III